MGVIIIGEAAAKIMNNYKDFVAANPQVSWRNMSGMRNRLTHAYSETNFGKVWYTTQLSLPQLIKQIENIMIKFAKVFTNTTTAVVVGLVSFLGTTGAQAASKFNKSCSTRYVYLFICLFVYLF